MPYRYRRGCPICGKPNLLNLSGHLRQVHGLWDEDQRQPWLQRASHLPPLVDLPVEQYPVNLPPSSCPVIPSNNSPVSCLTDDIPLTPVHGLETQPHPEFAFQHPYSMMVVGPSQCGKTHFVHQLLTHKCIAYPNKKPVRVVWCYNQWQPQYDEIERGLGSKIRFFQGVPELENDLSEIKTSKHTIIVLDDLMAEAKDSPVVSKLFTQGRHRNASVILLLQNMFPKGKYNTDISRNATYKVLFRSPGDRKQIDIMADQTFAKDRPRFMQAYHKETARPYGYIVVDNHPRTTSEHQVVGNVLRDCYTYPHIMGSPSSHVRESLPAPREFVEQPVMKRQASKKRKVRRVERFRKKRKQPVYDSTSDEEEIMGAKTKREKELNWQQFSEQEDSDDEETEGEEEERYSASEEQQEADWDNPGEEENHYRGNYPTRGGGDRPVYDEDTVRYIAQELLKEAFYNPSSLYPQVRRRSGFGPQSHY